mmetsp:Transcript_36967/g.106459  ORF Transcript_36967/g.106459 Transcript_36967/m.106459 type:complete len:319 (-) Transcript_36967:602-1558(-)
MGDALVPAVLHEIRQQCRAPCCARHRVRPPAQVPERRSPRQRRIPTIGNGVLVLGDLQQAHWKLIVADDVGALACVPRACMPELHAQVTYLFFQLLDEGVLIYRCGGPRLDFYALHSPRELERGPTLLEVRDRRAQGTDHRGPGIPIQRVRQQQRQLRIAKLRHVPLRACGPRRCDGCERLSPALRAELAAQALDAVGQPHEAPVYVAQLHQPLARHQRGPLVLPPRQVGKVDLRRENLVIPAAPPLQAELEHSVAPRALRIHGGRLHGFHRIPELEQPNALLARVARHLPSASDIHAQLRVHAHVHLVALLGVHLRC